ncbi:hypothetical protein BGX38DRAFT_1195000 [Terfezia claveryi]|nr:hypothetical protein BGX38DRAFT_1195000 [Terfezia claveryi]
MIAYIIIRSINFHPQSRRYLRLPSSKVRCRYSHYCITIVVAISRLIAILLYYRLYNGSNGEIEAAMVGFAACLPAMRAFFRKQRHTFYAKRNPMVTHTQSNK